MYHKICLVSLAALTCTLFLDLPHARGQVAQQVVPANPTAPPNAQPPLAQQPFAQQPFAPPDVNPNAAVQQAPANPAFQGVPLVNGPVPGLVLPDNQTPVLGTDPTLLPG